MSVPDYQPPATLYHRTVEFLSSVVPSPICGAAVAAARLPNATARAAIAAKSMLRIRMSSDLATAGHECAGSRWRAFLTFAASRPSAAIPYGTLLGSGLPTARLPSAEIFQGAFRGCLDALAARGVDIGSPLSQAGWVGVGTLDLWPVGSDADASQAGSADFERGNAGVVRSSPPPSGPAHRPRPVALPVLLTDGSQTRTKTLMCPRGSVHLVYPPALSSKSFRVHDDPVSDMPCDAIENRTVAPKLEEGATRPP